MVCRTQGIYLTHVEGSLFYAPTCDDVKKTLYVNRCQIYKSTKKIIYFVNRTNIQAISLQIQCTCQQVLCTKTIEMLYRKSTKVEMIAVHVLTLCYVGIQVEGLSICTGALWRLC